MKKVYLDIEATVLLPVKVKLSVMMRTDDDANLSKELEKASKGKRSKKSDVEICDIEEIKSIGNTNMLTTDSDYEEVVKEEIQEIADSGPWTLISAEVTDVK